MVRGVAAIRWLVRAPVRPSTYRRGAHLLLGGILLLPFVLIGLVLADPAGAPAAARLLVACLTVAVAVPIVLLPGVRPIEVVAARALLGVDLPDPDPGSTRSWSSRLRGAAWYGLNLAVGGVGSALIAAGLSLAAALVLSAAPGHGPPAQALGLDVPPGRPLTWPAAGPPLAVAVFVVLTWLVALLGGLLARVAPSALGPGPAEALRAERAVVERLAERARLAQEIHDSIGHALTATGVQAEAAGSVFDSDPEFARRALAAIAESSRAAVTDLDRVVALLRDEGDRPGDGPGPQPDGGDPASLAGLAGLVERTRSAGTDVRLSVTGDLAAVPPVPARAGLLTVQEALTNAVRHGDTGPVTVELAHARGHLTIEVTNPWRGTTSGTRRTGGGHGLTGLAERSRLLGGTFDAGPEPGGYWRLRATLPSGPGREGP